MILEGEQVCGGLLSETLLSHMKIGASELGNQHFFGCEALLFFGECNTNHYRSMIHHFLGELNAM